MHNAIIYWNFTVKLRFSTIRRFSPFLCYPDDQCFIYVRARIRVFLLWLSIFLFAYFIFKPIVLSRPLPYFLFFLLEEIFTELYQSELELRPTWRSLKGQRNTGRVHRAKIVNFYTSDFSETGALCYHAFLDKVTNNKLIKL